MMMIQVYAPTSEAEEQEADEFYERLSDVTSKIKKGNMLIVMGDFNAKIGQGAYEDMVGQYGLGNRNDRGDRMMEFCIDHQLVVTNTYFKLPPRRLYTWTSPNDSVNNIVRNQIDYIMVNKRYRNSFQSVKTYPGADVGSDHVPLVATINVRFKKLIRSNKGKKLDTRVLKNDEIRDHAAQEVNDHVQNLRLQLTPANIQVMAKKLEDSFRDVAEKNLVSRKTHRKNWMTDEILGMMEKRRVLKNSDTAGYTDVNRKIKREVRKAKEAWMNSKCEEIELLDSKYDNFNLHKKVKEAAGIYRPRANGRLLDEQGCIILEKSARVEVWQTYIETLFRDERFNIHTDTCISGPEILKEEVERAIKQGKDGRAPGPDGILMELLKLLDDNAISIITRFFNLIYNTGEIPEEWLYSTFIPIPKKHTARTCGDYRTISLMSHLLKTFLKIVHSRIYSRSEEQMSNTQFGFRNALGTREALFSIQVLFQRCRDVNCDVFACFIDYEKAFDTVQHSKLITILTQVGLDEKDIRIIKNLYWNQSADIRVEGVKSERVAVQRGVRQGCVLSPMLFNLYSEMIFREALADSDQGISVNGEKLNNVRYADDTVIFADTMDGLQLLLNQLSAVSEAYGLRVNTKKTKFMVISKNQLVPGRLLLNNSEIEKVDRFVYLGSLINSQWDHSLEIKCRIEKARAAFVSLRQVLRNHHLNLKTKIRLVRCYVFPVLLYGVESWTLTEATSKKLEAFEMWIYRRILKISWMDHVTNRDVLRRLNNKELEIVKTVKRRKLEYFGHIMRHPNKYDLLQLILQGKVEGRRGPGRRRISWLKNLRTWFNTTTIGLFRAAVDKIRIAMWIANIR